MAKHANGISTQRQPVDVLLEKLEVEQQKVVQAELINKALVASIGEGVIVLNEYGDITDINDVALSLLGYHHGERDKLVGSWFPRVLPIKDRSGNIIPASERPSVRALLTGLPSSEIVIYVKKDGSQVHLADTASPFVIDDKPQGVIIVLRDLTREANIEKAKDEFISLTSHQLRSPLTSINLYSQLVSDPKTGKLNSAQADYLAKIQHSTQRLLQMVSDFLNISKIELGELNSKPQEIDITRQIEEEIKEVQQLLKAKKAKISFSREGRLPCLYLDPVYFSEAIHNLLTNAVRYSAKKNGEISVKAKLADSNVIITVKDNGIGIPEAAKKHIFGRLYRADNAIAREAQGTGLGLYLVKKIVEGFGGKIWFDSSENQGTTFYVCLPAKSGSEIKSHG